MQDELGILTNALFQIHLMKDFRQTGVDRLVQACQFFDAQVQLSLVS